MYEKQMQSHFIVVLLSFTDTCFLHIEGLWQSSKSIGIIFPTAFAHFMSLCRILVVLTLFQTFSLLFYLFW